MDPELRNLLYRHPELYEQVYTEPNAETPQMCRRMFERFLPEPPQSILDLGCGTARDLARLACDGCEAWGVDALPEMIAYAKSVRPQVTLRVADIAEVRLGRTFDVILCLGSAFLYALTDEEADRFLDSFAVHSHAGTLLVLDIDNAVWLLGARNLDENREIKVSTTKVSATARSRFAFDWRRQWLIRRRTWTIAGGEPVEDFARYRLWFPQDLEHRLASKGFRVVGMFDNQALEETDLGGPRLYVAALR